MKILWAIDAMENSTTFYRPLLHALRSFAVQPGVSIQPLCLLSSHRRERLEQNHLPLDAWLPRLDLPRLEPLRVVAYDAAVPELVAAELVDQARMLEASLVALATHAYQGPKRWLLGSVCEHLLRDHDVPVLVCRGEIGKH